MCFLLCILQIFDKINLCFFLFRGGKDQGVARGLVPLAVVRLLLVGDVVLQGQEAVRATRAVGPAVATGEVEMPSHALLEDPQMQTMKRQLNLPKSAREKTEFMLATSVMMSSIAIWLNSWGEVGFWAPFFRVVIAVLFRCRRVLEALSLGDRRDYHSWGEDFAAWRDIICRFDGDDLSSSFVWEGSQWGLGYCDLPWWICCAPPVFPMNWELWRRAYGEEEMRGDDHMCLSLSGRGERACLFFAKHLPFWWNWLSWQDIDGRFWFGSWWGALRRSSCNAYRRIQRMRVCFLNAFRVIIADIMFWQHCWVCFSRGCSAGYPWAVGAATSWSSRFHSRGVFSQHYWLQSWCLVTRIVKMRLVLVPHQFPAKLGWLWPDKGFMRNPLLALPRTIFTVVARILGINSMLAM